MGELYGITDSIGTEYYLDDEGRYTGEVGAMWDADSKKKAIECFVRQYDIDLEESYSYGDTNGDISMFRMTGHPIAINPTRELIKRLESRQGACRQSQNTG